MKRFISLLIIIVCFSLSVIAQTRKEADAAYRQGNFALAAELYENGLKGGPSLELYYNLGNAYYRLNDYGKAVLNYQRALRIDPSDSKARFNLQLTQAKLKDQFDKPDEMFFITFFRTLVNWQSEREWGIISVVMLVLALLSILVYWFPRSVLFRKVGFCSFLTFFVLTVVCNIFAAIQLNNFKNNRQAVVQNEVNLNLSPDLSSKTILQLHEGTTVEITDNSIKGWYQVQLPDGSTGWLISSRVERVAS